MASVLAYPSYADFERAAKGFVDKYKDAHGGEVGPERTNKGWEWKESQHKVSQMDCCSCVGGWRTLMVVE